MAKCERWMDEKKEEIKTKSEEQEEEERKIINKFPFVSEGKEKKFQR